VWPRRPLDLRARLLTQSSAGGRVTVVHGRTVDLSRTGAGMTLTRELTTGTEVLLCMQLPALGDALCLRAVIKRRRGFRVGLAFVEPTAEQRLLLSRLCYA